MAITLIGSNLNQWGDNGKFEADSSTWGFGTSGFLSISRSNAYASQGLYSCLAFSSAAISGGPFISQGNASLVAGKKYVAYAKVRIDPANPMGADADVIKMYPIPNANIINVSDIVTTTVLAAKSGWVQMETRFEVAAGGSGNYTVAVWMVNSGVAAYKYAYVDEFFIFEYVDVVPGACTIAINVAGSSIGNSTGSNGSITIAMSSGNSPFEYSKDNGATWQTSNVFSGLAVGSYFCKVREQANPTCIASYVFNVPASSYNFSFTAVATDETVAGLNNGTINVTVTGTVAPFTYSKDAGVTFVGGNVFTGLAPGIYTIVVKDAGGITRAVNVTVNAGITLFNKGYLSKNPIAIAFNAPTNWASLTNYRMYCEVRVEDVPGTSAFNSKLVQQLYPDASGVCLFNLRQAMRNIFSLVPPAAQEATIKKLTDRSRLFKLYTGTLTNDDAVPGGLTESLPYQVVYGGMGTYGNVQVDFFAYLASTKKFMTWQPIEKTVNPGQEDYLNYYVFGLTTSQIKLQIKAYYDDGTNATSVVLTSTVKYGEIYQLPAGPVNSGAAAITPAKNLTKYEVSLLDQSNSLISELRTYLIAEVTNPLSRYIMVVNSLGAHEVHLLTGESNTKFDTVPLVLQKYLPPNYKVTDVQFQGSEDSFTKTISYSTGFLLGNYAAQWREYFIELLLTRFFFDVTDGKRRARVVTSKTVVAKEDHVYDHFVRFDAMDAYENIAYTPDL